MYRKAWIERRTGTMDPVPKAGVKTTTGGAQERRTLWKGLGLVTAAAVGKGMQTVNAVGLPPGTSLGVETPLETYPVLVIVPAVQGMNRLGEGLVTIGGLAFLETKVVSVGGIVNAQEVSKKVRVESIVAMVPVGVATGIMNAQAFPTKVRALITLASRLVAEVFPRPYLPNI